MATGTLEERMSAMEQELAQLKQRLEPTTRPTENPWLEQIFGVFKDDPLFEEAVRYGREWRDSQRMEYEEDTDVSDGH